MNIIDRINSVTLDDHIAIDDLLAELQMDSQSNPAQWYSANTVLDPLENRLRDAVGEDRCYAHDEIGELWLHQARTATTPLMSTWCQALAEIDRIYGYWEDGEYAELDALRITLLRGALLKEASHG